MEDKSCGWIVCEYHSKHEDDYYGLPSYCMRKEGKCECGAKPEIVWEWLLNTNDA